MSYDKKHHFLEIWLTYRRFLGYIRPDALYIGLAYLTIIIVVITNTAMIWLIGMPFNLLQQGRYDAITNALLVFAAVVVVNQMGQMVGGILTQGVGLRAIGRMRNAILEKNLSLSFPVAAQFPRGDLLARLTNDVDKVKACIVDALVFSVSHILTFVIYVVMLVQIDIKLALWALSIMPLFIAHQLFFAPRKRRATEKFFEANGNLLAFEEQALGNMRGISNYMLESYISKLHNKVFQKARFWAMKERRLDVIFRVTFSFLIYLVGLVIVLIGVDSIKEGRIGVGHLISFLLYLGYLTVPTRGFSEILNQLVGSLGAANRIMMVFDAKPAVIEKELAKPLPETKGDIKFNGVTFAYPNDMLVFDNINLQIYSGETIALVGPSGAGKSTLAMLLVRFYDCQSGSILIDNMNIGDITLTSLRKSITVVSQEPFLINDTIRANLIMVKPDANEEQLINACLASHAWEFIEPMKHGLDTPVGLACSHLSTGQRQRLAIAQAFLRDPPVLIMDEATSALDSYSEQKVLEALKQHRKERTTLIISHRYSSIKATDRVIYFNGDGTVTCGKHDQLIKAHTPYQEAVYWQTTNRKTYQGI